MSSLAAEIEADRKTLMDLMDRMGTSKIQTQEIKSGDELAGREGDAP